MARRVAPHPGLAQVRALAHPLRLRLLELFAAGPLTARQAAERLGQPPTRLYHHVATLERSGLLRLVRTQRIRGATEKYFELVPSPLRSSRGVADALRDGAPRDREAVGFAVFDQARNELVKALAAGLPRRGGPLMAVRLVARLSPAAARRLRRDLVALIESLRRDHRRERERRGDGAGQADGRRRGHRRFALT